MQLNHIAIVVKDLDAAEKRYEQILGKTATKRQRVDEHQVEVSFFDVGSSCIELVQPTSNESSLAKYLEKHGEGLHHLAFETGGVEKEIARLEQHAISPLPPGVSHGANDTRVCFFHPKDAHGVLIEFIQKA